MTPREVAEQVMKKYSEDAEHYSQRSKMAMNELESAKYNGICIACSAIVSDLRRLIEDDKFGE